ncbi:transglutaminase-like domain-containing protein [Roseivivax isoporae]|uniref:Transglutaminase n=1 Tax=Roseivivax isoporae LMG 25204 TaxID=1449351 RepID=X7F8I7_9RHOB|nr:transglutaminase family protein [Roseivivax isoporae]ETX29105.1 transglutaminase [Roseivivax isoporae LMG 25204]
MTLRIEVALDYALPGITDCLAQIRAATLPDQEILRAELDTGGAETWTTAAEDGVGERLWLRPDGGLQLTYSAEVAVNRPVADLGSLAQDAPADLPSDAVKYLFPSRYCPSDKFLNFVGSEFGGLSGGAMVAAMRDFVLGHFSYVPGASDAETSALETFVTRQGVCRDFAHMLVTLARAGTVPARYVSVYGLNVVPQDFHAVVEVWLAGRWHMIDPSGMSQPGDMAKVCVGRDATDVAFLTTYGMATLRNQSVSVTAG